MRTGNKNLFVTNSNVVCKKQMDGETLEYWPLVLFPTLTCLKPLEKL